MTMPGTRGITVHDELSILPTSIEVDFSSNHDHDHNETIGHVADLADTGAVIIAIKPLYLTDHEGDVNDDSLREFLEQVVLSPLIRPPLLTRSNISS